MSGRNPKRSSRLAAKEESREVVKETPTDTRKRSRDSRGNHTNQNDNNEESSPSSKKPVAAPPPPPVKAASPVTPSRQRPPAQPQNAYAHSPQQHSPQQSMSPNAGKLLANNHVTPSVDRAGLRTAAHAHAAGIPQVQPAQTRRDPQYNTAPPAAAQQRSPNMATANRRAPLPAGSPHMAMQQPSPHRHGAPIPANSSHNSTGAAYSAHQPMVTDESRRRQSEDGTGGRPLPGRSPVAPAGASAVATRSIPRPRAPVPGSKQVLTEDLQKGLGGAIEKWISARSALGPDDAGRFPKEIQRLMKSITFEACDLKHEVDEDGFDEQALASGCETLSREITTTRFRVAHPEIKAPFIFEATHHMFSGSVLGSEGRIDDLLWKVEFELIGFFLIAFHTQTLEVGEEIEGKGLDEIRQALNTNITPSELGVLFMLAGNACRGPKAWNDVEDVCFWTANFSLPEFQVH